MDEKSLATELLGEVKASARRWFIAFCIMIGLEIATIVGFMWYISLPVEETSIEQTAEDNDDSDIRQFVGGDDDGKGTTESNTEEKSR